MRCNTISIVFYIILILTTFTFSKTYNNILEEMEVERINFQKAYQDPSNIQKDSLIAEAKKYITQKLTKEIFPSWYGTPWDFNGTTYIPQIGEIACGYFVTTTLVHAGFNIPRYKWAQLSAENIIKKLTLNKDIKRSSNISIDSVKSIIINLGTGLFVVGLDCHVGFIYNDGSNIFFIHSNYYKPDIGVMSESIYTENPLKHSHYRVLGKLFDDNMITLWILNKKIIGY